MLDLRQGLARNRLYSSSPAGQRNNSYDSSSAEDFGFLGRQRSRNYGSFDDLGSSDIEFQTQFEDGHGAYSPPLWKTRTSKIIKHDDSPLLPHNHYYSDLSPKSRLQAIMKGRSELMEMVRSMPESSYELSLKDIVDKQHISQEVEESTPPKERGLTSDTEIQIKNQKRKRRSNKKGQILRSESMDSGVFLLKMFFPTSLMSRKASTVRNHSKISPRPSFDGTENLVDREWWKKRFLIGSDGKSSGRNSSGRSTSSSNGSRSRLAEGSFLPGCWPFFHTKKSKMNR